MAISMFELFKAGIGPSSSHTVGPMEAARRFAGTLVGTLSGTLSGTLAGTVEERRLLISVHRVKVSLYGSLGATGKGHGTGPAVMMGLEGERPDRINPEDMPGRLDSIRSTGLLALAGQQPVRFREARDIVYYRRKSLPEHPNGMVCQAFDREGRCLLESTYYSVGGGFVVDGNTDGSSRIHEDNTPLLYPFNSGKALLALCHEHDLSIADIMAANEQAWRSSGEIRGGILELWQIMRECVQNGISHEGELPGGLKVRRRAASLYRSLMDKHRVDLISPSLSALDWVNLYALAVNEENAAGGRIVTAPTNGAAGIIPAVLHYYWEFCPRANADGIVCFMLTAAAIGVLFKVNASISGAEVGCQGEVGSACAMAAAGLAAATGGSPEQVENAAEIAMEHHLGMTCDPIGGLVQIPCIERNAMASVKAIDAAIMALRGDGKHYVSLDKVLYTMRETGRDMLDKYKETARGGLAVNIIEC